VELDRAIMEPCDSEFMKCLSEEGITSNRGQQIKGFTESRIVKFFLKCGKTMGVECYFSW